MSTIRNMAKNIWFSIFVIAPTILAIFYYALVASDIYISESRFTVKSPTRQTPQISTLANLIQTTGLSAGQEQASEVVAYIKSRDALTDLQRQINIKAAYTSRGADIFSRYPKPFDDDHSENLFRYYSEMVDAHTDADSGLAVLTVRAFQPNDAQKINALLLNLSEGLVNRLNNKARGNAISEARERVTEAEQRVSNARQILASYRNRHGLLDPAKQAVGVLEVSNGLVAEQAALTAQLENMQSFAPHNPAIPALQGRITAIGIEIATQNGRAVGTSTGIASKLSEYEKLASEQGFAEQTLTAANAALETARTDSARQQFYLERVVEPNRPDLALLPRRMVQILTVFALSLCIYMIGWMLVVGILEHAPED